MTKIRTTLFRFGFGYAWQNKGVQEVNLFIRCFRQRLIDNHWQDWKSRTDASDRFNFYRQFKTNHVQATYPSVDVNKYIRNSLIKFRFGVSPIVIHSLRYKTHAYTDTICPLCRATVENEVRFIFDSSSTQRTYSVVLFCSKRFTSKTYTWYILQPANFI